MKKIKIVSPYVHPGYLNFKQGAYKGWCEACSSDGEPGCTAPSHYPWRILHGLFYRYELPVFCKSKKTAMLMLVEPVSLSFDTFPYYATHEIVPMFWDCWPAYYDKVEAWMKRHGVKTAVFTSSQEMEEMMRRLPDVNMLHCPEAVDVSGYKEGGPLKERAIDLLEFGRSNEKAIDVKKIKTLEVNGKPINHVATKTGNSFIYDNARLYEAMGDAKITLCLPKSMTHPQVAQGVETLTQRYWEAMLSRMVILGVCPEELSDLIGYNPCIEMAEGTDAVQEQIKDILEHIGDYQPLVDKNRETALQMGSWEVRMRMVKRYLTDCGYAV